MYIYAVLSGIRHNKVNTECRINVWGYTEMFPTKTCR